MVSHTLYWVNQYVRRRSGRLWFYLAVAYLNKVKKQKQLLRGNWKMVVVKVFEGN